MTENVTFGSATAAPGNKAFGWLEVCMMADGSPLRIPIYVFNGKKSGPRLTVISAQHAYEISEIEVCRQIIQELDPEKLAGTLVVVPIANPISFEGGTRSTWVDSLYGDNGNMNRVWPGRADGWLTERMVHLIGEELVKGSDAVIDLHNGTTAPPGLTIYYGYAFTTEDQALTDQIRAMAVASGFDILIDRAAPSLPGSLGHFVIDERIPFFACEVGEFYGIQTDGEQPSDSPIRTVPEHGITAVYNIMKHLGMLEGGPELPERQILISPENNLRPAHGGALYSEVSGDAIGRVVPKDFLLGTVISPYTFETMQEIRAPYDENLILAVTHRHPFARVNAGDYGYIVADMKSAEWINH